MFKEIFFCSLTDWSNSYLMVSSVVGFYSLRAFAQLTPRKDDTTMTTVRMELKDRVRGEVGARVLGFLLVRWCDSDPLCFIYFLFSLSPSSSTDSYRLRLICPIFVCGSCKHWQSASSFLVHQSGVFFLMRGVYVGGGGGGGWGGCVFRLSRSGIYSLGNEFGSGEAC